MSILPLYINGIIQYMCFCVWLLSGSITRLTRGRGVALCVDAGIASHGYTGVGLPLLLLIDTCLQVLVTVNQSVMNSRSCLFGDNLLLLFVSIE